MRPVISTTDVAPLPPNEVQRFLDEHLPYRLALIRDAVPRVPAQSLADDQAFEAAAVAGRVVLDFLGIGYDQKRESLKAERTHRCVNGLTDDVKVVDLGGRYIDFSELNEVDTAMLTRFIHGVHKACAHLTASKHGLDSATFQAAASLISRLYEEHIKSA